jgi:hypothetical protein
MWKSVAFLYTHNEQKSGMRLKWERNQENNTIHNSFKKLKYLQINLIEGGEKPIQQKQ